MNRSYTKIRRIQEANILLERRFLLSETVSKYDKAKPNENQWYTAEDPKSVKTPKGWRIYVKKFGQDPKDPITDVEFNTDDFKGYFIEYSTQQEADTKFNEFYNKLITKQTNPQQNDNTTTTTTLKPGETPSNSGSTETSGKTSYSDDDLIKSMTAKLQQQGYK